MIPRVLALVHAWLVLDFFGDSRRSGQPGSSLTTTIFTQSFIGLVFATFVVPEPPYENDVAYLAANLSLSTLMVGIGLLGDPHRYKRALADEVLVRTAPVSATVLALARALHGGFHLCLVTIGMALPPAILAWWVCGQALWVPPIYLVVACLTAGIMAGCLAVFTRAVHLLSGPARAQLVVGTLKALLVGGGFLLMVICLRHLDGTAGDIPLGPASAWAWPPYWAARFVHDPGSWWFLGLLLAACVVLYLVSSMMQTAALKRSADKPPRHRWLAALDRAFAGGGALLGVTAFISTMLYRSPGFRVRVLPLFGLPIALVLLSFMAESDPQARRLLLGMTLQFPAIFLPFLVGFMPRSDHEGAGWIFEQSPHVTPALFRAAGLIALTTHVILPVHAAALAAVIALGGLGELAFPSGALALGLFSAGMAILVAWVSLQRLEHVPFTVDEDSDEAESEMGGLFTGAILLSLLGGGFALIAHGPFGLLIAPCVGGAAILCIRRARRHARV